MVYELIHEIKIDNIKFKITDVIIQKSIDTFTSTATVTVPKRLRIGNKDVFSDFDSFIVKKGQTVSIKLGYRVGYQEFFDDIQFTGFVSKIIVLENTVKIECEDYMYFLKKTKFNFSSKKMSIKELAQKIITETNKNIPDGIQKISLENIAINLDLINVVFENLTGVEILDYLKKNYTLDSFFLENVLNVGVNYSKINADTQKTFKFSTFPQQLIKQFTKEKYLKIIDMSGLTYQKIEDVKYKIKAKIFTKNSEFFEVESGDPEGEERTFIFSGNYTQKEIKELIDNQLLKIKYEGFQKGSFFTTFGKPSINLLDVVTLDGIGFIRFYNNSVDNQKQVFYKKSSYLVSSLEIIFGASGFRQKIGISLKVSDSDSESLVDKIGKPLEI